MSVERYGDPTPREQPNLESFDPEGDLILAVEGRGSRQFRLVLYKILRLASPGFTKSLSPEFREGMRNRRVSLSYNHSS